MNEEQKSEFRYIKIPQLPWKKILWMGVLVAFAAVSVESSIEIRNVENKLQTLEQRIASSTLAGQNSWAYLNACAQVGFCPTLQQINDRFAQISATSTKK